jgi:hypothetical protein
MAVTVQTAACMPERNDRPTDPAANAGTPKTATGPNQIPQAASTSRSCRPAGSMRPARWVVFSDGL